jgi:hypothetical protein
MLNFWIFQVPSSIFLQLLVLEHIFIWQNKMLEKLKMSYEGNLR